MATDTSKKTAAINVSLDKATTARVDKCHAKVHVKSRTAFAEEALEFVMPLIESGQMVNLNGRLVLVDDAAKQLNAA